MNKLTMSKTQLQKLKTQIRAELNLIRFGPQKQSRPHIQRSPSQRRHFERTYTHIFKDVFNPKPRETVAHHNLTEKKHYQNSQITTSPRLLHHEKKHYRQPVTDFTWTPKGSRTPKLSMRREMKERSRSRSQGALSSRLINSSKEKDKENIKEFSGKKTCIYLRFY